MLTIVINLLSIFVLLFPALGCFGFAFADAVTLAFDDRDVRMFVELGKDFSIISAEMRWSLRKIQIKPKNSIHVLVFGVETAMLLASSRRLKRNENFHELGMIRSVHYFLPVIDEIQRNSLAPDYIAYLQKIVESFSEKRKSIQNRNGFAHKLAGVLLFERPWKFLILQRSQGALFPLDTGEPSLTCPFGYFVGYCQNSCTFR